MEGEARAVEASARPMAKLRINYPLFFLRMKNQSFSPTDSADALQAYFTPKLLPKCRLSEETASERECKIAILRREAPVGIAPPAIRFYDEMCDI
jgi:hypothetical protein